jgi:hypothetical protein
MIRRITHYLIYGICVTLAFLLSFRAYAPHLTPSLDSDNAVHILMAYDLKLPHDLYYWGQNRLGSLLPILAHGLLKVSRFSAAEAVAYVQYFILLIGFLCLSSLFQSFFSKVVFAFVWFLPIFDFSALISIAHPYAPQFALIGLTVVLVKQIKIRPGKISLLKDQVKNQILIFGAGLCLAASLWVSELSVIFIILLLGTATLFTFQYLVKASWTEPQLEKESLVATLEIPRQHLPFLIAAICNFGLTASLGLGFIAYAKQHADTTTSYSRFANLAEIQVILSKLWQALFNTLTFQSYSPFLSLYAGLMIVLLIYLICLLRQQMHQKNLPSSSWFYLFAISAVSGMMLLVVSWWVYINEVSLRYFVIVYVSGWIAVLLCIENLTAQAKRAAKILVGLIVVCALVSSAGAFAMTKPVGKIEQLQALKPLGKAGFIGEYWHSYILCAADPKRLSCTSKDPKTQIPCELDPKPQRPIRGVRCPRCARKVLKSEHLYLVQDAWLASFPAEIQQFGICLVKAGEPLQLAGYSMAPYRRKS